MTGIGEVEFQAPKDEPGPGGSGAGPRVPPAAIIAAVLAVVILGIFGYLMFGRRTAPATAPQTAAAPVAAPAPAADDFERIDLPPLDDSDALVRQRIGILSGHRLVAAWLATKNLIRNFVLVIDNISHGMNPSRHLRVLRPTGQFRVRAEGDRFVIDPRTYDRFSGIADAASSIDARSAGRLYQSFKPLLQTAYDELGNQEPVDRAVERAITALLAVPVIDGDVRVELAGEGIGYAYSDAKLEDLNGAQKQLLRMGAKNVRVIQSQLRAFATTIGLRVS